MDNFGNIFKILRTESGLTQSELAEQTELSQSYIVKLEKGLSFPSPAAFSKICSVLSPAPEVVANLFEIFGSHVSKNKLISLKLSLLESKYFSKNFFLNTFPYMERFTRSDKFNKKYFFSLNKLFADFISTCTQMPEQKNNALFSKPFMKTADKIIKKSSATAKITLHEMTTGAYYNEYIKIEDSLKHMHEQSQHAEMDFRDYRDKHLNSIIAKKILSKAGILPGSISCPVYAVLHANEVEYHIAAIYLSGDCAQLHYESRPESAVKRLKDFFETDIDKLSDEIKNKAAESVISIIDTLSASLKSK